MLEVQEFVVSKGFEKLKDNIINSIANPLFIKDVNHRWVMFNKSFCKILNISGEDLMGKSDYDFFSKKEADVFWEKDDDVLKTGKANINEEELTNKDGEKFTILTSKVRIEDEEGNYYILGTITDVTDMKFDEIQLEKKNLQINAQKNEIKNAISELHNNTEQNLQIINSLINALSDKIDTAQATGLLLGLKNWLNSMIMVNQFFSESFNVKTSLIEYLNQLSSKIAGLNDSVNLLISGDPIIVSIRYMSPIGLMIAELLQASKVGNKKNAVRIELLLNSDNLQIEYNSDFELITENDATGSEFGLWDLLNILVKQIDGSIVLSPDRTRIRMNINNVQVIKRGIIS